MFASILILRTSFQLCFPPAPLRRPDQYWVYSGLTFCQTKVVKVLEDIENKAGGHNCSKLKWLQSLLSRNWIHVIHVHSLNLKVHN